MIIGPLLVVGYNAELFGGVIHTDLGFAAAWGAFPALTGYVAEAGRLAVAPVLMAGAAMAMSAGQRHLSTPARMLRRRTADAGRSITLTGGDRDQRWTWPGCLNRWNGRYVPCRGELSCSPRPPGYRAAGLTKGALWGTRVLTIVGVVLIVVGCLLGAAGLRRHRRQLHVG